MEIKTLEHYAVAKIQELENEVNILTAKLQASQTSNEAINNAYNTLVNKVREGCTMNTSSSDGGQYINFQSVYEKWDKEDFAFFVRVLGLNEKKGKSDE